MEKLCGIFCTQEEIANIFGVHIDTLNNQCKRLYGITFSEFSKEKSAMGKMSLRRTGFKMAEKNPAVWIFHAKNKLGMTDQPAPTESPAGKYDDILNDLADTLPD